MATAPGKAPLAVLAAAAILAAFPSSGREANAWRELDVLTLNLRSRLDSPDVREAAVASWLSRERPDVVLLQEVGNVDGTELTQAHRLAQTHTYDIASCYNPYTQRGLAVLSRFPIVDVVVELLPRRARPALGVVVNLNGRLVSFVNVHLTPQMDAASVRKLELRAAVDLLQALPGPGFIAGDFNFGDAGEENTLLVDLVDAFRALRPKEPGYTWDLENPLARKNSYTNEPSRRLDRILFTDRSIEVRSVAVVLTRPVQASIFPSDHYGVLARVRLGTIPFRGREAAVHAVGDAGGRPSSHQPALPRP